MTKIAFFEIEPWEERYIKEHLKKHQLAFFDEELDEKSVRRAKSFDIISVFVHSEVNSRVINQLKNTKAIVTRSTGFDHIDLKVCKEKGILVSNTPYYGENTVAEYTFALILGLSRQIPEALGKTKKKDFS
ncbi:MAG: hydroxyacid dehydrogenase, partial [Candidatus Nanoarchaeia archaeon]